MDIRFCSICNESIPDVEFDAGRAISAQGRSQHVACALERATQVNGMRSWLTSVLALFAAAAALFLLVVHFARPSTPPEPTTVPAVTRTQIDAVAAASEARLVALLDQRLEGLRSAVDQEIAPRHAATVEARLREDVQMLETRRARADATLDERIAAVAKRQDGVENQVGMLSKWHEAIQRQADALEEGLRRVAERPVAAPPPAVEVPEVPEAGPAVDPTHESELNRWLVALDDKDPDLVFTATSELGRLKDVRAVQPLIKVLTTHADEFPRAGAAGALGMIRAADAVPALIDRLLDKDELVQAAAGDAVEKITEQTFDFASGLALRERKAIQRTMRKWWKDNEEAVRARLGQPATGG
jgi:hypothetical protein